MFKSTPLKIGTADQVEDVIVLAGDHLEDVESFLKRAFGEPDHTLGSHPLATVGNSGARQGVYGPRQIGATLSFGTFTIRPLGVESTTTMITIIGSRKP